MRSNARAFLGDWFLCDLDQNLLTFTQQISDRWLMSFAPRLSTITALVALSPLLSRIAALISSRALTRIGRRRRRRRSDLFLWLNKLHGLKILILAVCRFYLILGLCRLGFAFAGTSSATSTA